MKTTIFHIATLITILTTVDVSAYSYQKCGLYNDPVRWENGTSDKFFFAMRSLSPNQVKDLIYAINEWDRVGNMKNPYDGIYTPNYSTSPVSLNDGNSTIFVTRAELDSLIPDQGVSAYVFRNYTYGYNGAPHSPSGCTIWSEIEATDIAFEVNPVPGRPWGVGNPMDHSPTNTLADDLSISTSYSIDISNAVFSGNSYFYGVDGEFRTVALHELGHALGLNHEVVLPSLMSNGFGGMIAHNAGSHKISLMPDDSSGGRFVYGAGIDSYSQEDVFISEWDMKNRSNGPTTYRVNFDRIIRNKGENFNYRVLVGNTGKGNLNDYLVEYYIYPIYPLTRSFPKPPSSSPYFAGLTYGSIVSGEYKEVEVNLPVPTNAACGDNFFIAHFLNTYNNHLERNPNNNGNNHINNSNASGTVLEIDCSQ